MTLNYGEIPQTQSETVQMICAEWVRGMNGMRGL